MKTLNSLQLKQIAAICDALSKVELDDEIYRDNPNDATLINSELVVTTRNVGEKLGTIRMGRGSDYVFVSC